VAARGAAQEKTIVLELELRVVPEHRADGTSHEAFDRLKAGRHRFAPVAEAGVEARVSSLVAMPITQASCPAPHEVANGAPPKTAANRAAFTA
jgi:hypothetical protein